MRALSARYPDDLEAATLFAQSLMDTAPWNYWDKNGEPRAFTNDVLKALEDETGRQVQSEKLLDLVIANGKVVRAGNQFGVGMKQTRASQ